MMREVTEDQLIRLLSGPLPGRDAQWLMAPVHRLAREHEALNSGESRESAVLLLLNPFTDSTSFFLIERHSYDGHHSGQIGLPGGKKETGDHDFWQTALRETSEELGVASSCIQPLGALTELFIPVSRFWVYPRVGILTEKPRLNPDKREVKRVLNPRISDLLDANKRSKRSIKAGGVNIEAPVFLLEDVWVWGATAMILSEFSELIKVDSKLSF